MKKRIGLALTFIATVAAPAQAAGDCGRACLESYMTGYLAALTKHDPTAAKLAPTVKYTENQSSVPIGDGLWKNATEVGPYHFTASDVRRQQIAYLGNLRTSAGWTMLAVRLRILDGQITEVETVVPGTAAGAGTFDLAGGAEKLGRARPQLSGPLKAGERRDRSQIIQAADLHYEGIERGNGDIVPFGDKCIKIENGVQLIENPDFQHPGVSPGGKPLPNFTAMSCHDQFNTHVWETDTITDRRYPVVDEERGIVVAFAMYNQYAKGPCANVVDYGPVCPPNPVAPYSLAIAEAFKVRDGLIEEVESIFTVLPEYRVRGLW